MQKIRTWRYRVPILRFRNTKIELNFFISSKSEILIVLDRTLVARAIQTFQENIKTSKKKFIFVYKNLENFGKFLENEEY